MRQAPTIPAYPALYNTLILVRFFEWLNSGDFGFTTKILMLIAKNLLAVL